MNKNRVQKVRLFLVSDHGIARTIISSESFGELGKETDDALKITVKRIKNVIYDAVKKKIRP